MDLDPPAQQIAALLSRTDLAMRADAVRLERRLRGLQRRVSKGLPVDRGLADVTEKLDLSIARREQRGDHGLEIAFDDALPITQHRDQIVEALQKHPVLIIAGETGSGKTTQLPKMCLLAGRGTRGWIGVTQPRRIAARSISARLAEETGAKAGEQVGYEVRFDRRVSPGSLIKVMTDGILLAETQSDRAFDAYDTLIIDEAHERSLNIDFLLGYLKQLLPRRPDLRVIITSATIDTERFSKHFSDAPVIEVSGRGYPVDVRYRSPETESGDPGDWADGIVAAVDELNREDAMGDILVFLPGERDIRDAERILSRRRYRHTEILPLLARLPAAQQQKIFHPGSDRRIILATNVAETSLTVPRIKFVIDSGLARVSRYSHRSKIQRLPIEPVSQASANQRSGRCGRLGPGIAIRLYDEEDFGQRDEYTEPEILRTNLATVILTMEKLALGSIEDFPFVDSPDTRLINDGYQLLFELGALNEHRRLTQLGSRLADWPLDVRMARLMEAGHEENVIRDAAVLAAFASIADPRERPMDRTEAADTAHEIWADPKSDFSAALRLFNDATEVRERQSNSKFRGWCKDHFLNYLRMREWMDLTRQLMTAAQDRGWKTEVHHGRNFDHYTAVHKAVCAAFLGQIGQLTDDGYQGTRQRLMHIFPGSYLFGTRPKWIVAGFVMETQKVYMRMCAQIDPGWLEPIAGHVLKRHYFEPFWSAKLGRVMGYEQVSLYGLILVPRRRIHYAPHDPKAARKLFLVDGLVRDQLRISAPFREHNARLIRSVEKMEEKRRRRDLLVDEAAREKFFATRVPEAVVDVKGFEAWRRKVEKEDPRLLFMTEEDLLAVSDTGTGVELFPNEMEWDGVVYPLIYRLEPGTQSDGVTVKVPLHRLTTLTPRRMEWLVPGYLAEKVAALIKTLPKPKRRHFVPAPDFAREFVAAHDFAQGDLVSQLASFLNRERTTTDVSAEDFSPESLPDHLRLRIAVYDGDALVDAGRDLETLQEQHAEEAREEFLSQAGSDFYADDLRSWSCGPLPEQIELEDGAPAFPALVDLGDSAGIRLFETRPEAEEHHLHGLHRLLTIDLKDKLRYVERNAGITPEMGLHYGAVDTLARLKTDFAYAVGLQVVRDHGIAVRDRDQFMALCQQARLSLTQRAAESLEHLKQTLAIYFRLRTQVFDKGFEASFSWACEDIAGQLGFLVYPGFLTEVSLSRLEHYPRYMEAIALRIERLNADPRRDRQKLDRIEEFWHRYLQACEASDSYPAALDTFHWLLEEYRVSLFAQELGTAERVSAKRLTKAWTEVEESLEN